MVLFEKTRKRLKEFNKLANIAEMARRYFALNSFDGVLTISGILIATFFADIYNIDLIIVSCIGAAVALAVSGISGALIIEHSERKGEIKKLEKQIGMSLKKTDIHKAHLFATIILSLINGLSPLLTAGMLIIPFFLDIGIKTAYYLSFSISAFLLFFIGIFLGKISKENLIKSGIKMLIIGAICFAILFFIERLTG